MTQKSEPKRSRNQRTSIIINGGVSRQVVVPCCPVCGKDLKGVEGQSILTRFKCPDCGTSIENTRNNRCPVCDSLCASSEDLNTHLLNGCAYAGSKYPIGDEMRFVR